MTQPRPSSRAIFHFIYNSVYVLLCIVLTALVLVSPADAIRQALLQTYQYSTIVVIAVVYLTTLVVVLFVYSLRLYVTRTVLASIPKTRTPLAKGDVTKAVRDMVRKEMGRSAAIAWAARPKITAVGGAERTGDSVAGDEDEEDARQEGSVEEKGTRTSGIWRKMHRTSTVQDEMGIAIPPTKPVWGEIEHPGWGSPNSPDLPNVQYSAVLAELPNLIEAKAISLAPAVSGAPSANPLLDPEAVALLQRTANMGMRSYLGRLVDLGVLEPSNTVAEFLDAYEQARFSCRPMSVEQFRRLMHLFAEILRSAQPLDRAVMNTMHEMEGMYSGYSGSRSDIDDDAPDHTSSTTPDQSQHSMRSLRSHGSSRSGGTRQSRLRRPDFVTRRSSGNTMGQYGTAPTTPKSRTGQSMTVSARHRTRDVSRSRSARSGGSANSFAQTRRPFEASSLSSASGSLRSSQDSEGSVIRLSRREDDTDLPYVLRVSDTL